ncbi:MAG TPA: cystathionine gamma-synthase [Streptosporangiaceae bacterium]
MAQLDRAFGPDGFETQAIHAGQDPDPQTGAVIPPIYQVSTYKQDGVGGVRGGTHSGITSGPGRWVEGYEYSRTANPTRGALEDCLAALEGGVRGLAFASGMAAEDCLIRTVCRPGDHVLIPHDAYGGTYRLFDKILTGWGLTYHPVPVSDPDAVRAAAAAHSPRLIWVETPTNPLLSIADIAALAGIAHSCGALLAVDNTFASPYLQQPLALGADAVVHSTTKYLGGHSDVVGGALVVSDAALAERLAFTQNSVGSAGGPFDAWLTLRGIKTLAVRMDRHSQNARQVALLLANHPAVAQVYYPGLADHPGHEIAAKQMRAFGGMVSFRHAGGEQAAVDLCGRTRLFTLGESLGGVESLIEHPARMTHASVTGSPLEVPGDLVRLSVGIESIDDLLDDLRAALG